MLFCCQDIGSLAYLLQRAFMFLPRRCHVHSNFSPMCVLTGYSGAEPTVPSSATTSTSDPSLLEPNGTHNDTPVCSMQHELHRLAFHFVIADATYGWKQSAARSPPLPHPALAPAYCCPSILPCV